MSDAPRCEPPPELRDRDGAYWLCRSGRRNSCAEWLASTGRWRIEGEAFYPTMAYACGWRYLSSVATPAAVAAMRAERDAAVRDAQRFEDAWDDVCSKYMDAGDERDTLRAEVERLRDALTKIERLDRWHPAATTDLPPCRFATGVLSDIARAALGDKP